MKQNLAVALGLALFAEIAVGADKTSPLDVETACPGMAAYQHAHPHPDPYAPITDSPGVGNPGLRRRLLELYASDEKAGGDYGKEVDKETPDPAVVQRLKDVRSQNLTELKSIVRANGFPSKAQVGEDGVWAAYLLSLHADGDHEFQKSLVSPMKRLYEMHEIPGQIYAYIRDRTLVADGQPQEFGTQFHSVGNTLVLRPVAVPESLAARRLQADLPAMRDYACYVEFRSGRKLILP